MTACCFKVEFRFKMIGLRHAFSEVIGGTVPFIVPLRLSWAMGLNALTDSAITLIHQRGIR